MQFITASLGVECEFCHVQGAFEKDDKKTKADCAENDGDDVRHQSGKFRWPSRSDLLFLPPGQDRSGGDALVMGEAKPSDGGERGDS